MNEIKFKSLNEWCKEDATGKRGNNVATLLSTLLFFAGFVISVNLREEFHRTLFVLTLSTGIDANILFWGLSFILICSSIILFVIAKRKKNYLLMSVPWLIIPLVIGFLLHWTSDDCKFNPRFLSDDELYQLEIRDCEKEGYFFISQVQGIDNKTKTERTFNLYVKKVLDKEYYYCSPKGYYEKKYVVSNFNNNGFIDIGDISEKINGMYLISYSFDWNNTHSSNSNDNYDDEEEHVSKYTNEKEEEPQKIIVEHQRQLVPVQEWITCSVCKGTRNCNECGGSGWLYSSSSATNRQDCYHCNGRKDCPACGGKGGYYQTVYR